MLHTLTKRRSRSTQSQSLEAWCEYVEHVHYLNNVERHLHAGWAAQTAASAFTIWNTVCESKRVLLAGHVRCKQRQRARAQLVRAMEAWNTFKRPRNTHTQVREV